MLICQKCNQEITPGTDVAFIDDDGNTVDVDNMRIVVGGLHTNHVTCPIPTTGYFYLHTTTQDGHTPGEVVTTYICQQSDADPGASLAHAVFNAYVVAIGVVPGGVEHHLQLVYRNEVGDALLAEAKLRGMPVTRGGFDYDLAVARAALPLRPMQITLGGEHGITMVIEQTGGFCMVGYVYETGPGYHIGVSTEDGGETFLICLYDPANEADEGGVAYEDSPYAPLAETVERVVSLAKKEVQNG
jgi:hypothetical protein